jgi:hypothetical protein
MKSPRDRAREALTVLISETGTATISLSGITFTDLRVDLETRVADAIADAEEEMSATLEALRTANTVIKDLVSQVAREIRDEDISSERLNDWANRLDMAAASNHVDEIGEA